MNDVKKENPGNLPRSLFSKSILIFIVAVGAIEVMASTHYRWQNEQGEAVYSDRPPPKGVDYEVLSTGSSFKREVSGEEGAVPLSTDSTPSNQFDQKNTASKNKKNPEMCQRAKTNLEALTSSDSVRVRNAQGEVRLLNPEEMEIERQTAKAQISVYCP